MSIILNVINYFWKLGFSEVSPDIFEKEYVGSLKISIDMANEVMIYGEALGDGRLRRLPFIQRNFVIMEAVDRFIRKGYQPRHIVLRGEPELDFEIQDSNGRPFIGVKCLIWEDEYESEVSSLCSNPDEVRRSLSRSEAPFHCVYSSRLKAGLIESRYSVFPESDPNSSLQGGGEQATVFYDAGLLEESVEPYHPIWTSGHCVEDGYGDPKRREDFTVQGGRLLRYRGAEPTVVVPERVLRLGNSVFWNHTEIEEVIAPQKLISLGGDTFFDCRSLVRFTIPASAQEIGDNPFAGCPELDLRNESPWFRIEDGALYDARRSRLIYCSIKRASPAFHVPDGVISIGKHSFYNCSNLERIVIPPSVRIIENNPFSNLPGLKIENQSEHFTFFDGALYNSTMSTLFYYELGREEDFLSIPEGVHIIGRHSFYNCKNISKLVIPSSVRIVGYNPFAGCSSLTIENHSPEYRYEEDTLYDRAMETVIFHSPVAPREEIVIPGSVEMIGRSAFLGCSSLRTVRIPEGVTTIDRSAFANCANLTCVEIPSSIKAIGEWAFFNCPNLRNVSIPEHTMTEKYSFHQSPVRINLVPSNS